MLIIFPLIDLSIKAELDDLLFISSLVKTLSPSVVNNVNSADCSSAIVASGRLKILLAFKENKEQMCRTLNSGNTVFTAVNAVCNPSIPFFAYSNSQVLLSHSCGI